MLIGTQLPLPPAGNVWANFNRPSHGRADRFPDTFLGEMKIAAGSLQRWPGKLKNAAMTLFNYLSPGVFSRRMESLEAQGVLDADKRPSRWQMMAGGIIMIQGVIAPDYNRFSGLTGTSAAKKNFLRVLMQPATLMDPFGLFTATPEVIIEHLMQTDHRDARYDFDLMHMWGNGAEELARLRREVESVRDKTHPHAEELAMTAETDDYFDRLIQYIDDYVKHGGKPPSMQREGVRLYHDRHGRELGTTFAGLRGFLEYCHGLPTSPFALIPTVFEELRGIKVSG